MDKAESNRQNASHSTGPKTPKGKAAVAQNALKHGAYSEALAILFENPEDFANLRIGIIKAFHPKGLMEEGLVERMASLWWRMDRTKLAANQALLKIARYKELYPTPSLMPGLNYMELEADVWRVAGAWDHKNQERFLRHEMTLERSFFRLLHELERIQARRQGQAVPPPAVLEMNLTGG